MCDADDCYETMHDVVSADYAHEDSHRYGEAPFVTAKKMGDYAHKWMTWCQECALQINLDWYENRDWTIAVPEGFTRGVVCPCSEEQIQPWGYQSNGEPWMIDGKSNPAHKWIKCKRCEGPGWLKEPSIEKARL
jgi:hypothetical protein